MTVAPGASSLVEAELEAEPLDAIDGAVAIQGRSPLEIVRARLRKDKVTMVALVATVLFILVAIVSPLLARLGVLEPNKLNNELVQGLGSLPEGAFGGISWAHPLGVEPGTGRDLLSRILTGITTSLTVAVLATVFSVVTGTVLGIVSGYSRGKIDWFVGRLNDLVLSFPQTLMLIALSTIATERIASLIGVQSSDNTAKIAYMAIVLGLFGFPFFARVIRGQVLSLREREFIEAARSLGARSGRIYFKELLPHLWAPLLVYTTLVLPANISAEAALGFLGVGITPPTASLGAILNDSVSYAIPDPAYFFFPGFTVFILVLAFNLLGDGLRDALDPRAGRS
jgi:peptide/nickel transport system permease protein